MNGLVENIKNKWIKGECRDICALCKHKNYCDYGDKKDMNSVDIVTFLILFLVGSNAMLWILVLHILHKIERGIIL